MLWIIGKDGMLGRAFCRILKEKNIPFIATSKGEVDITHPVVDFDFDTAVNCSGYTAVDHAEKQPQLAHAINIEGVEALARLGKKVIHFSTDYVFDGSQGTPYSEKDFTRPLSVYGQSKRTGEERLLKLSPESLVIRTSWLFGREGRNFVLTMRELMKERDELQIVADQVGRPTFCDDLVHATLELLDESGIIHFANSGVTTWYEFAQEIGKEVNYSGVKPISSAQYDAAAKRPHYSVLDTAKVEALLGKTPRHWKEALKDLICKISS